GAIQQAAGIPPYLPYPLVPRSVNWKYAPNDTADETPNAKVMLQEEPARDSLARDHLRTQLETPQIHEPIKARPGAGCNVDDDCVKGAICSPQLSWSGVFEMRCLCRPPFIHVSGACVPPEV